MLINSAQKMPSIQRRISIESRDPAHQLSANILGSYLWRLSGELAVKPTTNHSHRHQFHLACIYYR